MKTSNILLILLLTTTVQIVNAQEKRPFENRGGSLNSLMQAPAGGRPQPTITYDGSVHPGIKSPRQAENKASLSSPIYGGPGFGVTASLSTAQTNLGDSIYLDNGKALPTTLHRNELGILYSRFTEDKRNFRTRVTAGYAGDENSISNELTYSVNASYSYPSESGNGSWMLMVYSSNNSPLIDYIPIPGFAYILKTPTFTGMFGLPILSMQWMPEDPWVFSFSAFGPIVQSEVAYGMRDKFQSFVSLGMLRQSYLLSDRQNDRDRLTLSEARATTGFRLPLNQTFQMEVQGGRSFARTAYIGSGFLNRDGGKTAIEPDWFLSWGARATF